MGLFNNMLDKLGFDRDDGAKAAAASRSTGAAAPSGARKTAAASGKAASGAPAASSAERASSSAAPSGSKPGGAPATPAGAASGASSRAAAPPSSSGPATQASSPREQVDVIGKLETLAASNSQRLNWRESIVDLMKVLDLDSSLAARKELAAELGCPADKMGDSAQMNTWLHKAVLRKLAENGGNVPKEMLN